MSAEWANRPRTIAIRHVAFEDLGILAPLLEARGIAVEYLEAGRDDPAPAGDAALLVVLGGPIGAYEERDYPFLSAETSLVERRLRSGLPTLGICLGAQIMARALGARVYPSGMKEIGWGGLALTEAGRESCLAALNGRPVLHWHGDTFDLPAGAARLASTGLCENQAFAWGEAALALQFHAEVTGRDIERWLIGHTCELNATKSVSLAGLRADTERFAPALERAGAAAFGRWFASVGLV